MRRPLVLAVVLAVGLVLVLVSQARLRKVVEDAKKQEEVGEKVPQPAASPEAPVIDQPLETAPTADGTAGATKPISKDQVMAALLETRQIFQNREQVSEDMKKDPHRTSGAITEAAGKLADLAEMAAEHPQYQSEFNAFYLDCAKDEKVITITRIQCLERYFQATKPSPEEKSAVLKELPPVVTRLFSEIDRG